MNNKKAQGTIEYLVIIGVIVVISLVVVGLLVEFMNTSSITDATTNIQTQIGTSGLGINEAIADISGEGIIDFRNNSPDTLTITKISTPTGENTYSKQIPMGSNATISLEEITQACNCTEGQTKTTCEIDIYYTTKQGLEKKITQTLTIGCTQTATPAQPEKTTSPTYVFLNNNCYDDTADPIPICTLSDLNRIRDNLEANYELQADIDATPTATWNSEAGWQPITHDYGEINPNLASFNGANNKIVNLKINRPLEDRIGLFGIYSGTIQNIGLIDINFIGKDLIGGIIAETYGGDIFNSYTTGIITGNNKIGGIAAENYDNIYNNYSTHTIIGNNQVGGIIGHNASGAIHSNYSTGIIFGNNEVGGIAGFNESAIYNSHFTGDVNGVEKVGGIVGYNSNYTYNSYSTGTVTGTDQVGGGIGFNYGGLDNIFSLSRVNGTTNVGGLVGKTDAYLGGGYYDSYYTNQEDCYGENTADATCISTNNQLSNYYSTIPTTLSWSTIIWTITENALPKLAWE